MDAFSQKDTQVVEDTQDPETDRHGESCDGYSTDGDSSLANNTADEDELANVCSEDVPENPAKEKHSANLGDQTS